MQESEVLSALIADTYDAALDPPLWPGVLEKVCAFVRGSAANLFFQDFASKSAGVYFQWGNDLGYEQLYLEKYVKLNPLFPALTFFEVGAVRSQSDIIPYAEFHETRFYREWVRPQGVVDVVFANLEKSATASAVLAVRRHERDGYVDDEARRRMALIVPHVRRAVLIGNVIDFHKTAAVMLTDTLAGFAAGVFLVDTNGQIVFVNASGQVMLGEGKILRDGQGRFTAANAEADQVLRDVFAAAGSGDIAIGVKGISVPLPGTEGEGWLAHVLPLTAGARREAGITHAAAAAVFVRKASLDSSPSVMETIAKLYKLTPSELRVLQAVVEIGGMPAVADALGISESTVRTHLKSLFEKTGTHRQADLVKLVAGASSPFAS